MTAETLSGSLGDRATARLEGSWLTVEVPLSGSPDPWDLLKLNAGAAAGVKFALGPDDASPGLIGELRWSESGAELEPLVDRLRGGLLDAMERLEADGVRLDQETGSARPSSLTPRVSSLCQETRWEFQERDGGRIAVPLEAGRCPSIAVVGPGAGGPAASAELARSAAPEPGAPRDALASLLLRAGGVVRLARAVVIDLDDGRISTGFESPLPPAGDADDLHHALCALSVACNYCGPEAALLQEDSTVCAECLRAWSRRSMR